MKYIKFSGIPNEVAIEAYSNGHYAEAIQILHGYVECKCRELLMLVS